MKNITILVMILGAAFSRLIPHVPNVTAVTAMALLGGAYLSNRSWVVLVPVLALFISDFVIGFHSTVPFVYGSVIAISLLSFWGFRKGYTMPRLAMASISSSILFFFVTNLGVWMVDGFYPRTAQGLVECYVMALPFLGTQTIGDLFYTGVLFGAVELVRRMNPALVSE